jgi:hypothetical protein
MRRSRIRCHPVLRPQHMKPCMPLLLLLLLLLLML